MLIHVVLAAWVGAISAMADHRVERCGITFGLPVGWIATVAKVEGNVCEFGVSPKSRSGRRQAISVSVFRGSIANAEEAGFKKNEAGWFTEGREGVRNQAHEIRTPCCLAIRGTTDVGRYDDTGYAGSGEMFEAFVVGKGRVAYLASSLEGDADQAFDPFVLSIRFK